MRKGATEERPEEVRAIPCRGSFRPVLFLNRPGLKPKALDCCRHYSSCRSDESCDARSSPKPSASASVAANPPTRSGSIRPDPARTNPIWPIQLDPTRSDPVRPNPARGLVCDNIFFAKRTQIEKMQVSLNRLQTRGLFENNIVGVDRARSKRSQMRRFNPKTEAGWEDGGSGHSIPVTTRL